MVDIKVINFNKLNGLVPCVVQDATTLRVLMLGFMNEEAFQKTVQEKKSYLFQQEQKTLMDKRRNFRQYPATCRHYH